MAVTPIDLYTISESGHCYIRPETHDITTHLHTDDYLIDEIAIAGAGVFGKIQHPKSPIIVFPAKHFVQLYWREINGDEVHRTILGGSPEASCFGGLHIEPLTVYAIRNIMATEVEILRYRPWQPQNDTLETISSNIHISH